MSDTAPPPAAAIAPGDPLAAVAAAIAAVPGLTPLPCDGRGHPIEDAVACLHVRCTLASPRREEVLGRVGPLVRRAKFVMAALVDRADLYCIGYKPGKRGRAVADAAAELADLLADPAQLEAGEVPDRRGR